MTELNPSPRLPAPSIPPVAHADSSSPPVRLSQRRHPPSPSRCVTDGSAPVKMERVLRSRLRGLSRRKRDVVSGHPMTRVSCEREELFTVTVTSNVKAPKHSVTGSLPLSPVSRFYSWKNDFRFNVMLNQYLRYRLKLSDEANG